MIQFRPYQETAIQSARDKIAAGVKRILLNSPTGSGKTVIAAGIVQRAVAKGKRVLEDVEEPASTGRCSNVIDLMAALKNSLKGSAGGARKPATKKSAPRKPSSTSNRLNNSLCKQPLKNSTRMYTAFVLPATQYRSV